MKSESQALLAKARQSIQAAENLKRDGFQDFAVSRAYYSMFYAAEALLLEQGLSYNSHTAVIGAFGKLFAKTGKIEPRFHRYLLDAQDTRNIGDYGIGPGVTTEQVEETLNRAEEFLQAVTTILVK
jgi:uncharacterized protein (UPF0332 family)